MTFDRRVQINELVNGNGHQPVIYRFDENGREYYAFKGSVVYPFPCDEQEQERMDQFHTLIYMIALEERLYTRDVIIPDRQARVLDVGYGTGIWAQQMAAKHPHMQIYGIDLIGNHPAPEVCRTNAFFRDRVDFNGSNWGFPQNSFDFIHLSQLCGAVADWSQLYGNVYRHLKPGTGYIEHIEIDWTPRWDSESSLPPALETLSWWWNRMVRASNERPIAFQENTRQLLIRAGFEDPMHRPCRINLMNPVSPKAKRLKQYFQWFTCWRDKDGDLPEAFEALSLSLLYRGLGIPPAEIRRACTSLCEIYASNAWPIYHNIEVWTARKPAS